jgi:hypothetical protein
LLAFLKLSGEVRLTLKIPVNYVLSLDAELIAVIMLVSAILPFVIRPPKAQTEDSPDATMNQPKRAQNPTQSAPSFEASLIKSR